MNRFEKGSPVVELCREAGISQVTKVRQKNKYPGLMSSEMNLLPEIA